MCFSIFIPSLSLFSSSPPFPASYTGQASTPHSTFTIIYPTRYKVYLNNNTGSSLNNEQNVSAIASLTTTKKSRNQTREKKKSVKKKRTGSDAAVPVDVSTMFREVAQMQTLGVRARQRVTEVIRK